MKLSDGTGAVPRMLGVVGLVALVATVLWMPEPEPEAPPVPETATAAAEDFALAAQAEASDPQRLGETSRVRRLVPLYPGASFTPMGLLEVNGNMMEMGFFEAAAPVEEVLAFYTREFGKRGRRVVEQAASNGGGTVNYYDETLGALVAVTAAPKGGGGAPRTLVFPSLTSAPDGIFIKAQAPERLPQPPGLMTVMRVDDHSQGPTRGSITLTQVAPGTPGQLAGFYRQQMPTLGYQEVRQGSTPTSEAMDFEDAQERVSISIAPMKKDGAAESAITVIVENKSKKRKGT